MSKRITTLTAQRVQRVIARHPVRIDDQDMTARMRSSLETATRVRGIPDQTSTVTTSIQSSVQVRALETCRMIRMLRAKYIKR